MTDRSYLDSDRSERSDGWMDGSGSEIILQNQVPPYSQCSLLRAASKRRSDHHARLQSG